jgi:tetratricopeptide (TPR) repeat protein
MVVNRGEAAYAVWRMRSEEMATRDLAFQAELNAAIDLSNEGKWKKALKALDGLVKGHPDEMQPRFERAMVLLNLDRDADAIKDLEHVLQREPDYPGAKSWYATAQAGQGKPLLAAEVKLEELKALAPGHWAAGGQAWADCAVYFLKANAPERALEALDTYFADYESQEKGMGYKVVVTAPHRMQAKALLVVGRPQEALVAAERACAAPHSVPADRFVRITALAAIGDTDRAVAEFKELAPDFKGTASYTEAAAELKRLGAAID